MNSVREVQSFILGNERAARYVRLHCSEQSGVVDLQPPAAANQLVQQWGYQPISAKSWLVLYRASAVDVARRLMHQDLAYKAELMPEKTAEFLANALVQTLSKFDASFACNAEFKGNAMSWDPIGTSTFEAALVGFDRAQAFLLYAAAED